MSAFQQFMDASFIWRDAIFASVLVAVLCGWLGIYAVLQRIVFLSATIPQTAGLGIGVSFFLTSFLSAGASGVFFYLVHPVALAFLFSILTAVGLSLTVRSRRLESQTWIGIAYVLSSALVILVLSSPRLAQEAHEIDDILFGNAVVVSAERLAFLAGIAAVILLVQLLFFKEVRSVLFDRETSRVLGLNVPAFELITNLSFALAISMGTYTIGALPVFGFMVIPPACGLMLARRLHQAVIISAGWGLISAVVGYYLSFIKEIPTGPTMIIIASLGLPFAALVKRSSGS